MYVQKLHCTVNFGLTFSPGSKSHITRSEKFIPLELLFFHVSISEHSLNARRISNNLCPPPSDLDALFDGAMQRVRQTAHGAVAPVACVQAVRAAATMPYTQGMEREKELMATLFTSGQARALQYCFFAQRAVGRWSMPSGARWDTSKPRPIHKAAVIGKSFGLLTFFEHKYIDSSDYLCSISKFTLPVETKPSFTVQPSLSG